MENMAEGPGFTRVWLLNRSSHGPPPLTEGQVSKVQDTGPGSQPGGEAPALSSDGLVTNAVLARATLLSFVCCWSQIYGLCRTGMAFSHLLICQATYVIKSLCQFLPSREWMAEMVLS